MKVHDLKYLKKEKVREIKMFPATTNDALDSNNQQQQLHQATYQGLPHAPTAHQALELGPMTTEETSNLNPILMSGQSQQHTVSCTIKPQKFMREKI